MQNYIKKKKYKNLSLFLLLSNYFNYFNPSGKIS